jgi:hypothetical protein
MVRVHSDLPFQVAASFSTCDFLPVFSSFIVLTATRKIGRVVAGVALSRESVNTICGVGAERGVFVP